MLFIHVIFYIFLVGCGRNLKMKIRKKTFESQVKLKLLPSGTNEGSRPSFGRTLLITSQSSFYCRLAVVLIEFFGFQGWEFKYSFQILEERTVSSGGCCSLYLVCGSTSVRKHSSPVFSFQHSLHSSVDGGWRILSLASTVRKQNVL